MPKHSTALTKVESTPPSVVELTFEIIRKYINPRATDAEMFTFQQLCKHHNLDPFSREAYLIKYKEGEPASFVVGFEVYLKRAERTGLLDGWRTWIDYDNAGKPHRANVEIWRKDWTHPFVHSIVIEEYRAYKNIYQNGQYVGKEPNKFWKEKEETMAKKCVAGQGFRLCFSGELAGMPYTSDELPSTQGGEETLPAYVTPITDAVPKEQPIPASAASMEKEVADDAAKVTDPKPAPTAKKAPAPKKAPEPAAPAPEPEPPAPAQATMDMSLDEMKEGIDMLLDVLERDHHKPRAVVLMKLRKRLSLVWPNIPGDVSIPADLDMGKAELVVKILMETIEKEPKPEGA